MPDVRRRTNNENPGAFRGGVDRFLDGDITPRPDLLVETEKVIRVDANAVIVIGTAYPSSQPPCISLALRIFGTLPCRGGSPPTSSPVVWTMGLSMINSFRRQEAVKISISVDGKGTSQFSMEGNGMVPPCPESCCCRSSLVKWR
jgi:hypothetical protein